MLVCSLTMLFCSLANLACSTCLFLEQACFLWSWILLKSQFLDYAGVFFRIASLFLSQLVCSFTSYLPQEICSVGVRVPDDFTADLLSLHASVSFITYIYEYNAKLGREQEGAIHWYADSSPGPVRSINTIHRYFPQPYTTYSPSLPHPLPT